MHIGGVISGARQFCYPNDKCEMQMKCYAIQFDMKWNGSAMNWRFLFEFYINDIWSIKAKFSKNHTRKISTYFPKVFVTQY